MQREVALLLCLTSSLASADLGKKIESLNANVKSIGGQKEDCSTCTDASPSPAEDSGLLMRTCVESLCANKGVSLDETLDRAYTASSLSNPAYDSQIGPLVNSMIRESALESLARVRSIKRWLRDPKDIVKPAEIRLFNLFTMGTNSFSKFKFKQIGERTAIDVEKSRPEFLNLSDEEFKKIVAIGTRVLAFFADTAITETDPARVQLVYADKFMTRVEEVLASIPERRNRLEADPDVGDLFRLKTFNMETEEALRKKFSGAQQVNPEAIYSLNRTNSLLNVLTAALEDAEFKKLLDSPPIQTQKIIAGLDSDKILSDRTAQMQSVLSGASPSISAKCRLAFELAQKELPSQSEIERYKARIEVLKKRFLELTKPLVCEGSSEKYQEQVLSWSPHLPQSREQHLANMKTSLSQALSKQKKWKERLDDLEASPHRDSAYTLNISASFSQSDDPADSADDVCNDLIPDLTPDATMNQTHQFVVGPLVVKNSAAEGIAYHEMGHKLYRFMRENSCEGKSGFSKARACLQANHQEGLHDILDSPLGIAVLPVATLMENQYENEDWSDMIAAHVEDNAINFACIFARKLRDEDYKKLSLANSNSGSSHSSALFRLLHTHYIKNGKTPPQCEHALATRGESAFFRNCLPK